MPRKNWGGSRDVIYCRDKGEHKVFFGFKRTYICWFSSREEPPCSREGSFPPGATMRGEAGDKVEDDGGASTWGQGRWLQGADRFGPDHARALITVSGKV